MSTSIFLRLPKAMRQGAVLLVLSLGFGALLLSCEGAKGEFRIISGSENTTLEPLVQEYAASQGWKVAMEYRGSVDIMLRLQADDPAADAVWPANSLWISLGDGARRVKHASSVMTSPVVFGIKKSKAESLGFVGKDVGVRDILARIRDGSLRFAMTSATQSNSGASAYLGFLNALAGNPDTLTEKELKDPRIQADLRDLLAGVNRLSGSSGWLKDLFLASDYDAMVNYEATVIETNRELEARGREALLVVYPSDGTTIADSPLGFIASGSDAAETSAAKEAFFLGLVDWLQSGEIQARIAAEGRRTGFGGLMDKADPKVFRPDWGIDTARLIPVFRLPSAETIKAALKLYQTELRKPSFTVFALDYSGSMGGDGEAALKEAMRYVLDQNLAGQWMLETGDRDVVVVLPFSNRILDTWTASGGDARSLSDVLRKVTDLVPDGGTDIYSPAIRGLEIIRSLPDPEAWSSAVILMTDGVSNAGNQFDDLAAAWDAAGTDVPVYGILFGDADDSQLNAVAEHTRGRVFDGREDLAGAFRAVKGYN